MLILRRIARSPFLYLILAAFLVAVAAALLMNWREYSLSKTNSQPAVFSDSQFFFAVSGPKTCSAANFSVAQESFLEPAAPAYLMSGRTLTSLGFAAESDAKTSERADVEEYIVEQGDTLASLAEKFGISKETIMWVNDLGKNSVLKPGQSLTILPVSGVLHLVKKGDTMSEISSLYKVPSKNILQANNFSDNDPIFPGDLLVIPGAKPPSKPIQYAQITLPQSYFMCPLSSPAHISQGLHSVNAVDLSNGKCGGPVFAAAGGLAQRTGFGQQSGNFVMIGHPNGAVTYYGHLASIAVRAGQSIDQGQIIGYVGHTGHTIPDGAEGCHLHFDVRFATNPFSRYAAGSTIAR
ncbi:MAG: M23 family metallopeptidase [Patescibacteria group bacterium]|nr:M23 family metallopeptidase [Patescibacteria group bacterium]